MIFEHRRFDNELLWSGKYPVCPEVVAEFHGEDQRMLAYNTCPRDCVVVERKIENAV